MKIKINDKVLCLPPFVSTSWDQVRCLKMEIEPLTGREVVVISLLDDTVVKLTDLGQPLTEAIFNAHLRYLDTLEQEVKDPLTNILEQAKKNGKNGLGLEGFSALLHHNPDQANLPPLPGDILSKISHAAKTITSQEASYLPKPEPYCHCVHCQVARTLQEGVILHDEMGGEKVRDDELCFRTWHIDTIGDNLYQVSNADSPTEQFNVFLGTPVGCTCGQEHCEHIRAVLNS
jgi:hypothetical protein